MSMETRKWRKARRQVFPWKLARLTIPSTSFSPLRVKNRSYFFSGQPAFGFCGRENIGVASCPGSLKLNNGLEEVGRESTAYSIIEVATFDWSTGYFLSSLPLLFSRSKGKSSRFGLLEFLTATTQTHIGSVDYRQSCHVFWQIAPLRLVGKFDGSVLVVVLYS